MRAEGRSLSRRRLLSRAAAALPMLALAGLAGCGGSNTPTGATASSAAATVAGSAAAGSGSVATGPASAVAQAPANTPGQLSFMTWGDVQEIKVRTDYTNEFVKDHPSIKVTFNPTPQKYWDALQTRMAGNESPDIYYLEPAHVVDLQCRGALLNLSPYVQRDKYDLSDFYSAGPLEYTIDGKLWGLNRDFANQDIFYNVDMFKKAGVPLPPKTFDASGWTFDDFLAACQRLTTGSGPTKTFGFAVPTAFRAYMAFVWSNGGDIVTDDFKKPAIDQPNAVEGLQFLEDLIGKYKVSPTPADLQTQSANALFYTGRVGMIVSIPANLSQLRDNIKSFNWDCAPPPMGPHGTKRQVGGGGAGYGVYGKTKYPDQAWQFMQWVTSVKVQEMEVDSGTSMGSRLSVGEYFVKVNQGKPPENVQMFVDTSKNSLHTDPHAQNWLQIQNILSKYFADLWDASKPAKDVTATVAQQMAPLLLQTCGGS